MQYLVLGPLEVRTDSGDPRPVRRGRPRALLHLLLLQRRVVVPADVIADHLWDGEEPPHDAANGVHQLISHLRRALGPEGRDRLVTTAVGYRLDAADDEVDAWRFDRLLQDALAAVALRSPAAAQRALRIAEEAGHLWRGDPYPESSGYPWAGGEINRAREGHLQLEEARLEALLQLGRHHEVVLEAQSLAAAHPLRERFSAQHALALYRNDRQSEALDVLRGVRRRLADELGLDPGPSLVGLEQQVLRRDPGLQWEPPVEAAVITAPAGAPAPPVPRTAPDDGPPDTFPVPGLPPRPPELIGRDEQLAELQRCLSPGSAVTLTGAVGIGKTAMARTLARGAGGEPVWYVDLGDTEDPQLTGTAMARQLGYTGQLPGDPTTVLVAGFRSLRGLLVVDTCEHLVPTISGILHELHEQSPDLTILATSRRPLDMPDEVVFRLPPLPVPDAGARHSPDALARNPAVRLFLERARRVRSDFALDPATAGDVVDVVRAMEGLPLGLELAAAQAEALDAGGIRDRLDHHLAAPPGSAAFLPARQSSLTAALDASCVLLTAAEQQVLGSLAVFRGSFDLDAVRAVVGPSAGDPFPTLASLVRQSMVAHEGGRTYRLLRPVRDYALEKVGAGPGLDDIRARHAAYVATASSAASRELRTGTTALSRLHRLLADAQAAMEWSSSRRLDVAADIAVAYTWYWAINGLAGEGLRWLGAVAAQMDDEAGRPADVRRKAAVLRSLGLLLNPLGRVQEARDHCRRAIELSRADGDDVGTTAALLTLGVAEWARGDLAAAGAAHDEALSIASRTGERWHRLSALTLRARTALDAGDEDALERIEAAIAAGHEDDERQLLSVAMSLLARHHLGAGQADMAAMAAEGALEQAGRIHYREGELGALNLLGRARLEQGDLDAAAGCFTRALVIGVESRHRGALCETVESLALAAAARGRPEQGHLLLLASTRERDRLGLHVPGRGADTVRRAMQDTAEALGAAAALVRARVTLLKFDDLVADLLPQTTGSTSRIP